jgi:hypothetical protein
LWPVDRLTDRQTGDDILPQNREEFGEFFLRKKKREFSPEILRQFRHFVILRQKKESRRLVSIVHPVFTPTEVRTPVPTICDKV